MTREELDFIGSMNMCDEISDDAYKKIVCHCEEQEPTSIILDKIRAEIEQVKSIMNEEIINHDRKDLINFINGLNQSLMIIDKYKE